MRFKESREPKMLRSGCICNYSPVTTVAGPSNCCGGGEGGGRVKKGGSGREKGIGVFFSRTPRGGEAS